MSSTAEPYRDGVALWAAATDRAKTEAAARGANSGALLRQFVNDRFLARVFHAPHDQGRGPLGELDDIDVALGLLRSAAAVDLGGLGTGKTVNYS